MIKFYPPPFGYTKEEITKNLHWLDADVECQSCGKIQSVANTGYIGGPCIKCGKPTLEKGTD